MGSPWDQLLAKLIASENKRNPLTDDQMADKLHLSRQMIVRLRQKTGTPSYSQRRKPYLLDNLQRLLQKNPLLSDRELTRLLQEDGYDISKYTVSAYRRELPQLHWQPPDAPKVPATPFDRLVGKTGSMLPILKKAEAAVCYPPEGLHTLILGETGTGKTVLAEIMFQIAHEKRGLDKNKFIRFNCADYYNNPQLLVSQLFGHTKGSFTGADGDKTGLVEKADGGILFLDEIHRLPPEGQEILFTIIDKGKYRRLGETGKERDIHTMIIGATTEDIGSSLTLPFTRRIPMIIEMPPLRYRSIQERYELIKNFFLQEAVRIGVGINVSSEVICALLAYDCYGNIGQLLSDIQVACARAYIRHLDNRDKLLAVTLLDFSENVKEGLLRRKYSEKALAPYLDKGIRVLPGEAQVWVFDESDTFLMPDEIYKFIEERHRQLEQEGAYGYDIQKIVGDELESRLKRTLRNLTQINSGSSRLDISTLASAAMLEALGEMQALAAAEIGALGEDIAYYLSIHFHQSYERLRQKKPIMNPRLEQIKEGYPKEFALARKMLVLAEEKLDCSFPDEEAAYIAFYLSQNQTYSPTKNCVQIFVVTHGYVGREMAAVANRLLEMDFVRHICINLEEKGATYVSEAIAMAKDFHEGKGILLLTDMGATVALGDVIQKETGIPTKSIAKVHTAMVMDAAFKAAHQNLSLSELFESVGKESPYTVYSMKKDLPKALIILCMTGKGAALEIKQILEQNVPLLAEHKTEIIPLGVMADNYLEQISEIRRKKQIIAMIGTVDPGIKDIPYISMRKAMDQQGISEIRALVRLHFQYLEPIRPTFQRLDSLLQPHLAFPHLETRSKTSLIRHVARALEKGGFVADTYLEGVLQREAQGNTGFTNGIALAHTYPEHTLCSAIAIATLSRPILWEKGFYCNIVLFLALKNPCEAIIKQIYSLSARKEFCERLSAAKTASELYGIMLQLGGEPLC